ncbi:MAG: TetR/AcrR family transcriptional regulator [Proteobacteria bacterium]|nr:TetR/AcrR family transcriptional regulator [Pseudomonadota bacterium]
MSVRSTESKGRDSRRRKQILHAAERLLKHYGFGKTTVADIAREANVGVGTVYLEFPSKNAIVAELSVQRYQCVLDAMRSAAQGQGSVADRLCAMFEARITRMAAFASEGQHGRDLLRCLCPATQEAEATFRADEEHLVAEFLTRALHKGQLAVAEPVEIARILLKFYDSYSTATSTADRDRELSLAHRLILFGLLPRDQIPRDQK